MRSFLIQSIGQLVTVDPLRMTSENPLGIIEDGAIFVQDGHIAWLGSTSQWPSSPLFQSLPSASTIHAQGKLLMPGLIDSHTHTIFAGNRADEFEMRLQGKSYVEIAQTGGGILKTVQATRDASPEMLFQLTKERLNRMRAFGVTTVEVKSGYGLDFNSELKCLEVLQKLRRAIQNETPPTLALPRKGGGDFDFSKEGNQFELNIGESSHGSRTLVDIIPTYMGAHDIPPEMRGRTDYYVDQICKEQLPHIAERQLAQFCDVFCEAGYFDVPQSRKILETAQQHGLKLKIHAEEFACLGGAELAGELQATSADHLLHISDAGIHAMKQGGCVATLLPGTAFYLRLKEYAPALRLLEAGVPVALATDFNPGSCMIDNLQWIMALACLQMNMPPVAVIQGVTLNAAKALALDGNRGSLSLGKRADMALFDVQQYPELLYRMGSNLLLESWLEGVSSSNSN